MSLFCAVVIEGLQNPFNPFDGNTIVWVHGDITALTLPVATFPALTTTVLDRLENNDPGEGWSSDLRKPIGSGGAQAVRLLDDVAGSLGQMLLFDPTEATWDCFDAAILAGQVTIRVSGPFAPALGFYWIEEECIRVTAVAPIAMGGGSSALSYSLTVLRGQAGSRDIVHILSTAAFAPGDDGREVRLTLWQRPNFGAFRFRGTMYLLNAAYAAHPAFIVEAKHFFVDEEPNPGIPSFEVKLRDVAEVIEQHTFQIGVDTRCLYRIRVMSEGTERTTTASSGGTVTTVRKLPSECRLFLDRLRAAQLFGESLSQPGQNGFDPALVIGFNLRLRKTADVTYYVKLGTRDQEWLFALTSVNLETSAASADIIPFVRCALTLRDYTKGQSIDQEPDTGEQQTGDQTVEESYPNSTFGQQISPIPGNTILLPEEEIPTLQLWYGLRCGPVDAYLYLTSSNGGFSADPYDAIIGRGLGIPSDWQSRGVPPPNPLTARWDTLDLLELTALLNADYTYYVKSGVKLGDFLINLCTLHTLLHGPRTDGRLMLRRWARPLEGETPAEIDYDISQPIAPGERLTPLRAFLLYSGIKLLTLEPTFVRSVTLGGVAYRESGKPLEVRVWQSGNQLTDELLQQGQIGHLLRAFFSTMGGSPIRYSVPGHVLAQNFEIGDFVLLTANRLPTPQGRGLVSVRHIVVGADLNYRTGIKTYRLLRDYYGDLPHSIGVIAPSLQPEPPEDLGGGLFEMPLQSLGDPVFDPNSQHLGIWIDLQSVLGFVHVMSAALHNPTDQDDREGWAEAYGQVVGLVSDPGTGLGRLLVQFDPAWSRGGITVDQLLTPSAIVSLVDRRPATSNPQGALIEPIASQLAIGNDFLAISASNSFQRNFSVIG